MTEVKGICFAYDFDLVSWVMEHRAEIVSYRAFDCNATIFEMADGTTICAYT
jgi:hypothetical protein